MKNIYAFAFLLSGLSANSQIIYTDVNPDETYIANEQYFLDVNNDGIDDYIIEQVDSIIFGNPLVGVQLRSVGTVNEAVYETGSLTFLKGLALNDLIDVNETWTVPSPSLPAGGVYTIGTSDFAAGDWSDGLEHYAGLHFVFGPDMYYGWVRFTVASDGLSFTIMDYAYHVTKGAFILAGASVDGVEENEITGFTMQQNGTQIWIRNEISFQNEIEMFDLSGKLISSEKMNSGVLNMDLSPYENGIYIVRCTNEKGTREFKVCRMN
jgi:hypothetical protein